MRYSLAELIADKKLRGALAEQANEKTLDFEDSNGIFFLDFKEQSLLLNHRQVYDRLWELGGDKLLKKLLKEGNTCLTDDPDAAKQGVRPVQGTERYFLMTNAGATKAFSSILYGMAGWADMSPEFDAEQVCMGDFSDEDVFCVDSEDSESSEDDPFGVFDLGRPCWLHHGEECCDFSSGGYNSSAELRFQNGRYYFVSWDTGKLLSLLKLNVDDMFFCEALYDDKTLIMPTLMGFRYQMEENGKWGFISRHLANVTPAVYDDIIAVKDLVVAVVNHSGEQMDLTISIEVENARNGETDYRLPPMLPDGLVYPVYKNVAGYLPRFDAIFEETRMEDGTNAFLYRSSAKLDYGLFQMVSPDKRCITCAPVYRDGMLSEDIFTDGIPANGVTLEHCLRLFTNSDDLYAPSCLYPPNRTDSDGSTGVYQIRKDGFWALAELDVRSKPVIRKLLTPLAYTMIHFPDSWPEDWLLVERFGKKGVYHWRASQFLLACEYDSITYGKQTFTAVCGGMIRTFDRDGRLIPEELPACPACGIQSVKNARFCHMCGASLTKTAETAEKAVVQPITAEPPKPAPKPAEDVPTLDNFVEKYREIGRHSRVKRFHSSFFNGERIELDVCLRWNDDYQEVTDPELFLYADLAIVTRRSGDVKTRVGGLEFMKAYALSNDGIFYEKNGAIWFWNKDGTRRKLGEQRNVLSLTDEGNGRLTVEYVTDYVQTASNEHRDECGYMYEAWYNVYEVNVQKRVLNY